jgi:hypothetical protein
MKRVGRGALRASLVSPSGFELEAGDGDGVGALASSRGMSIEVDRGASGARFEPGWVSGAGEWIPKGAGGFGYENAGWGARTACDRHGLGVVGAPVHRTRRLWCDGVGGSARGAFSLGVGAGTRAADVAFVGDLVGNGNGGVGAGNGWGWASSSSWGVGVGTRRWGRVVGSR